MPEISSKAQHANAEEHIMRTKVPLWPLDSLPVICLQQLRNAQSPNGEVEDKRIALVDGTLWDPEDYDENELGVLPEGTDPTADISVCGIGGCAVRIFQGKDGSEIQTGECEVTGYCLKDRFQAVAKTETVQEGKVLYHALLNTCGIVGGPVGAGSFCPQLTCGLSAGVSEDGVPGTDGVCVNNSRTPRLDVIKTPV